MTKETQPEPDPSSNEVTFRSFASASAATIFVLFGVTTSAYGPLLISFSHHFHVSLPVAGFVLSTQFVGAFCGVAIGWYGMKRVRGDVVLSSSLIVAGLGAMGAVLSSGWGLFVTSAFFIGLGFGGVDISLSTMLVRTSAVLRAHRLSITNAGYSFGAVIGPLIVILMHPHNFVWLFTGVAAVAAVLSTTNRGIDAPQPIVQTPRSDAVTHELQRRTVRFTFAIAMILYIAIESSSAGWIAPQLHRVGYSQTVASLVTAGFWLGLSAGRIFAGSLHRRFSEKIMVLGGLGLAVVFCVSAYSNKAAPLVYPLEGAALASIYPMGLIWYTKLRPNDHDGVALLILFMMFGGVIGPAIVSLMISLTGIHSVPLVISAFALLDLLIFSYALRFKTNDFHHLAQ